MKRKEQVHRPEEQPESEQESNLRDIEKMRKARRRKQTRKRLLWMAVLALLIVGSYALMSQFAHISVPDIFGGLAAELGGGSGYPVDYPGGEVKSTYTMGRDFVILTDTNVYIYNQNGKQLRNIQHKMTNPVVRVNGSKLLVYDRGGRRILVESTTRTLFEYSSPQKIYSADVSGKGTVAVAAENDRYLAQLTVYDNVMAELFSWLSAENYITGVRFSPDSSRLAVSCVNARAGDLVSTIYMFDMSKDASEAQSARVELPGESVYRMEYGRQGVEVITDSRAFLVDEGGETTAEYQYQDETLIEVSARREGQTVLRFDEEYGKEHTVVVLDKQLAQTAVLSIPSHAQYLQNTKGFFCYLADSQLCLYSTAGELQGSVSFPSGVTGLQLIGQNAFAVTQQQIQKLAAK